MAEARPFDLPEFAPRLPWIGGDLQTLRNTLLKARSSLAEWPSTRLTFPMPDGTGDVLHGALHWPTRPTGQPLAVLLHGLTGSEDSFYIRRTARELLGVGYPVLRLNLRGAGPGRGASKGMYHAGRWQDLAWVLDQLPRPMSGHGLVLIGYSLGANMMLRFLGDSGRTEQVRAAVAVSAPIDLVATSKRMLDRRNYVYMRYLLAQMVADALASTGLDDKLRAAVRRVRNCYEFDDVVVAPANGFSGAAEYYERCQALGALHRIEVPTLLIQAQDDPWIPVASYLSVDWAANPKLLPLLPPSGGHVGFHDRNGRVWHDDCLIAFLNARDTRMSGRREAVREVLAERLGGEADDPVADRG